jgi:hypothetical protein
VPIITSTETRSKGRSRLWVLPIGLLVVLLGLTAIAPPLGWRKKVGAAVFIAAIEPEDILVPQGFSYNEVLERRWWNLRVGNWFWLVGVKN